MICVASVFFSHVANAGLRPLVEIAIWRSPRRSTAGNVKVQCAGSSAALIGNAGRLCVFEDLAIDFRSASGGDRHAVGRDFAASVFALMPADACVGAQLVDDRRRDHGDIGAAFEQTRAPCGRQSRPRRRRDIARR